MVLTGDAVCVTLACLSAAIQDPGAGDEYFDHLLTVTGVDSQFPDDAYHGTDVIHLEVLFRGLLCLMRSRPLSKRWIFYLIFFAWTSHRSQDHFNISAAIRRVPFASFALDRAAANSPTSGQFYSTRRDTAFGMALLGARDDDGSALPVRVDTTPTTEVRRARV